MKKNLSMSLISMFLIQKQFWKITNPMSHVYDTVIACTHAIHKHQERLPRDSGYANIHQHLVKCIQSVTSINQRRFIMDRERSAKMSDMSGLVGHETAVWKCRMKTWQQIHRLLSFGHRKSNQLL